MKLYGSLTSPYVRHCRLVLAIIQQPYELVITDGASSPNATKRVPVLQHQQVQLGDSTAIIRYLRELADQPFLPWVQDLDRFCLLNSLLDTQVNVFLLAKDGLQPGDNAYFARQQGRVQAILAELEQLSFDPRDPSDDVSLRLGAILDWCLYRQLFSLAPFPKLLAFWQAIVAQPYFQQTQPPAL